MSTEDGRRLRILLADDEPMVRTGLAMLISSENDLEVVGEADDGMQAVVLAHSLNPDVVVMDVRMPGMDGVDATRRIIEDSDKVTVLILTTFHDDRAVHQALRAGASGYILKNAAPHALAEAIRVVGCGGGYLDPAVARRLIDEFAARPDPTLPAPDQLRLLTAREVEVLVLIAHGLENSEIAGHLVISEATVKTHVSRILMKLGLHRRAQAVAAAYKTGLVLPTDQPPS